MGPGWLSIEDFLELFDGEDGVKNEGVKIISHLGDTGAVAGCEHVIGCALGLVFNRNVVAEDAFAEGGVFVICASGCGGCLRRC